MRFVILCLGLFCFSFIAYASQTQQQKNEEKMTMLIFTEGCYESLIVNRNFFHFECIKQTISRLISIAIVALSVILKVPQILKIMKQSKTTGLSFHSIFFESFLYSFSIAYNVHKQNPFMLYGENVSLLIQNVVISVLFKWFNGNFSKKTFLTHVIIFFVVNIPFYIGLVPDFIFDLSIYVNMALIAFARLPQIGLNYKNSSTGQLAFITTFLSFAGAVARCFTVFVSSTDGLLMLLNAESVVLNFTLIFQMIIYWNSEKIKKQ